MKISQITSINLYQWRMTEFQNKIITTYKYLLLKLSIGIVILDSIFLIKSL